MSGVSRFTPGVKMEPVIDEEPSDEEGGEEEGDQQLNNGDDSPPEAANTELDVEMGSSDGDIVDAAAAVEEEEKEAALSVVPSNHDSTDVAEDRSVVGIRETKVLSYIKGGILLFLGIAAIVVAVITFTNTRHHEMTRFHDQYENEAGFVLHFWSDFLIRWLWTGAILSTQYTTSVQNTSIHDQFPYLALEGFDLAALKSIALDRFGSVSYSPLMQASQVDPWTEYARENLGRANPGYTGNASEVFVFEVNDENIAVPANNSVVCPMWQIYPLALRQNRLLYDLSSDPTIAKTINSAVEGKVAIPGPVLNGHTRFDEDRKDPPSQLTAFPVFSQDSDLNVSGVILMEWDLLLWLEGLPSPLHALDLVIGNGPCGDVMTFQKVEDHVDFIGYGDFHDPDMNKLARTLEPDVVQNMKSELAAKHLENLTPEQQRSMHRLLGLEQHDSGGEVDGFCPYTVTVYPTRDFQNDYLTARPRVYAGIIVLIFTFVTLVFITYDYLVERRQRLVMASARRTKAIVDSMFPRMVRDRIMRRAKARAEIGSSRSKDHESSSPNYQAESMLLSMLSPKNRLKVLLKSEDDTERSSYMAHDEPIAEVFHDTTIMFADIAGFTAWSSEREPSLVFLLLETLYAEFDRTAKRLGVFKVETIGDCYVAATGLPDQQEKHAVIMARFASECILSMSKITQQLERILGPGTSDLQIRMGLHSGAVTAGVLRGEKSRFQLFGDTMNTASRMESTGERSRIQVSQTAADCIKADGKDHWLTPREELVDCKGKGSLQTFWCDPRAQSDQSSKTRPRSFIDGEWQEMSVGNVSHTAAASKRERLIEWNTDVLASLLAKVHATQLAQPGNRFLSKNSRVRADDVIETSELSEVIEVIDLPCFEYSSVEQSRKADASALEPKVREQLRQYVAQIAHLYRDNPFHNFEHASHVALSASKLMKRIMSPEEFKFPHGASTTPKQNGGREPLEAQLHSCTFGISSDPLTQFCVVLGALVHDVDHEGVPNATLVQEEADVALQYNNVSVAEKHSVQLALEILQEEQFADLRACIYSTEAEHSRFKQMMINVVLSTDIGDKKLQKLRKDRWVKAFTAGSEGEEKAPEIEETEKYVVDRKATIVIEHIIQASDVSHTMQHWHVYINWNSKLFEEMYIAFANGRSDKNPADFWYKGEIGFFDFYIIPLARKLKDCGVFGISSDEVLAYALENREEWILKGKKIVEEMENRASIKTLNHVAAAFKKNVEVQDRKYHLQTYKSCFLGSEAVDFLVSSQLSRSRSDAVQLGNRLMNRLNLFEHVCQDHDFHDDQLFYRFTSIHAFGNEAFTDAIRDVVDIERPKAARRHSLVVSDQVDSYRNLAAIAVALRKNLELKDRRYRVKIYKNCFVASSAVDFMLVANLATSRENAVEVLLLVNRNFSIFAHVCADHEIKDGYLFFRFIDGKRQAAVRDEDLSVQDSVHVRSGSMLSVVSELSSDNGNTGSMDTIQSAISNSPWRTMSDEVLSAVSAAFKKEIDLQDRTYHAKVTRQCFVGSEAVDYLVGSGYALSRRDAVQLGRTLAWKFNLFEHVTGEHLLRDGYFFYRFLRGAGGAHNSDSLSSDVRSSKDSIASGGGASASKSSAYSSEGEGEFESDNSQTNVSEAISEYMRGFNSLSIDTSKDSDLARVALSLRRGVPVRDRQYHLVTFRKCFVGRQAVDFLINSGLAKSRKDASALASTLMSKFQLFEHVTHDHGFKDGYKFYRFLRGNELYDENVRSMEKVARRRSSLKSANLAGNESTT